eukprot:1140308-Pelagomonas_calceolata.AAC.7
MVGLTGFYRVLHWFTYSPNIWLINRWWGSLLVSVNAGCWLPCLNARWLLPAETPTSVAPDSNVCLCRVKALFFVQSPLPCVPACKQWPFLHCPLLASSVCLPYAAASCPASLPASGGSAVSTCPTLYAIAFCPASLPASSGNLRFALPASRAARPCSQTAPVYPALCVFTFSLRPLPASKCSVPCSLPLLYKLIKSIHVRARAHTHTHTRTHTRALTRAHTHTHTRAANAGQVYGVTPFRGVRRDETFDNVIKAPLRFPSKPQISEECQDLISKLLVKDPAQRLGTRAGKQAPVLPASTWGAPTRAFYSIVFSVLSAAVLRHQFCMRCVCMHHFCMHCMSSELHACLCTPAGAEEIKAHPFFRGLNFALHHSCMHCVSSRLCACLCTPAGAEEIKAHPFFRGHNFALHHSCMHC